MSSEVEEIVSEPWYRCVRCRAMFKLKTLIIRHLILHKVHRFETDNDRKCVEDWDRVRVVGGTVVKVDLSTENSLSPSGQDLRLNHQQTSWILEPQSQSQPPSTGGEGTNTTTTLTFITNIDPSDPNTATTTTTTYLGPFDPIISQTFLKFDNIDPCAEGQGGRDGSIMATMMEERQSQGSDSGVDFPLTTEDLYPCRYCSAPFAHSRSRSVHEAKVHNEEMIDGYPCQICTKNFPTIASVQDHYRCTHKLTPPVKKAWKLWKTHGGHLNDYIGQPQPGLNRPSTNVEQELSDPQTTLSLVDPLSREAEVVMGSLGLGLDVTVEGTEPTSHSQEQQQEFESYYFHTDVGPIPITLTSTPVTLQISSPPQNKSSSTQGQDSSGSDLNKRKAGRKQGNKESSLPKKKLISSNATIKPKKIKSSLQPTTTSDVLLNPPEPSVSPQKLPKDSPFRYQRLKCPKCDQRFRTQWELTLHLGQIHAEFSCEFCSLVFISKVEMVRHQYTTHNTELGYYTCRRCRKNFGSPRIVQEHVHTHHPEARVPSTSVALKWRRA